MNAYEAGIRKNIPAVLIYVFSRFSDGTERVLMLHRDSPDRPEDFHQGKWNGLGGKCEPGESYRETAARELEEESELRIAASEFEFLGFLQFPNFKPKKNEDWSCMVFGVSIPEARANSVPPRMAEGSLHWIETERLLDLNLWEGDREFLPYVLAREAFAGCTWYVDGKVARSEIDRV